MTDVVDAERTPYRSLWTSLREAEFSQSFRDVDGVRTRVVEAGDPTLPAVVLLHGTGGHWEAYARNLKALSQHLHVIALDMIGSGFTDKPDYDYEVPVYAKHVADLLDVLGVQRASIIGMSLGSWVAARFALDYPARTDRLILMSPAGLVATASNMARIRAQRIRAVENPDWDSIKAMFDHLIADESNRIPDLIALRQAIYRLPETRDSVDHLLILQDPEGRARNLLSEEQWAAIQAPTLIIAAGEDRSEYQSTGQRIARLIPDSQVFEMPGVGHWPSFEDPESFNDAALKFLRA